MYYEWQSGLIKYVPGKLGLKQFYGSPGLVVKEGGLIIKRS